MDTQTNESNKPNKLFPSVLTAFGAAILSLLLGTVIDYIVVQILSQFFLPGCSEDCYFAYFNSIFIVIVLLSVVIGILSGVRTYKRLSERS